MPIQLGDIAPDFTQDSTDGPIRFHEWLGGSWGILFSHPKDFTPVCTTELGEVARLKPEFEKRNVKVIAVSVDDVPSHKRWAGDIEETQKAKLNYPILGDPDRKVANLYGMIHPNASDTLTVRTVFVIDPNKKVRLTITYPASTGRNFDEISARHRLAAAHRQVLGGHPRELERRPGRHHRSEPAGPRGHQAEVSEGLQGGQAVPAHHPATEQVGHSATARRRRGERSSARSLTSSRHGLASATLCSSECFRMQMGTTSGCPGAPAISMRPPGCSVASN